MQPSYFFHLKLELYPASSKTPGPTTTTATANGDVFVPPPGTDIFSDRLPAHATERITTISRPQSPANGTASPTRSGSHHSAQEALLLPQKSGALYKASPPIKPAEPTHKAAARDWRYGGIVIEGLDMEKALASQIRATCREYTTKATNIGYGVVHLYREAEEIAPISLDKTAGAKDDFDPSTCDTLCILAVPPWMTYSQFFNWVGEQAKQDVSRFRMIRTAKGYEYMMLMKFRSAKKAQQWQEKYNGKDFSQMGNETAHVVFIKSVEMVTPESDEDLHGQEEREGKFPGNTGDPFTAVARTTKAPTATGILSAKPPPPPQPDLRELPTCPVCLERMDETSGLLTILCQHVFHCNCIEKWTSSACPVCRYTHSPSSTFPYPVPDSTATAEDPMCSVCADPNTQNLWVCIICGNVGCGRYNERHAFDHFLESGHAFAMDITTQRIWDYQGDVWVHRLIQPKVGSGSMDVSASKGSGKDVQRHPNEAFRSEGAEMVPREKLDNIAMEYTQLLTSQLDAQRKYFEDLIRNIRTKADEASLRAEQAERLAEEAANNHSINEEQERAHLAAIASWEKRFEKERADKEKIAEKWRDTLKDWQTMKAQNDSYFAKASNKNKEVDELKAKVVELEEMNRDLVVNLTMGQRVEALGEEAEGGDLVVGKKKSKYKKKALKPPLQPGSADGEDRGTT